MKMKEKIVVVVLSLIVVLLMMLFVTSCSGKTNTVCNVPECKPWPAITENALCAEITSALCMKILVTCNEDGVPVPPDVLLECDEKLYTMCLQNGGYTAHDTEMVYERCLPAIWNISCSAFEGEDGIPEIDSNCTPGGDM